MEPYRADAEVCPSKIHSQVETLAKLARPDVDKGVKSYFLRPIWYSRNIRRNLAH